ncbi:hypothetical protein TNCV_5069461 [Trichonephila clavipes]|nr:hypothetical protein TNCV_5069461 [Trichonephila clavipes]
MIAIATLRTRLYDTSCSLPEFVTAAVAEWSRYRIVAGLFTSSSPVTLKTCRFAQGSASPVPLSRQWLQRGTAGGRFTQLSGSNNQFASLRRKGHRWTRPQQKSRNKATFWATDLIILSHDQITRTTLELSPPLQTTTPRQWQNLKRRQPSGQSIGSWLACHEFEPSTTKDPPCRGTMHVKPVESSNVLPLV